MVSRKGGNENGKTEISLFHRNTSRKKAGRKNNGSKSGSGADRSKSRSGDRWTAGWSVGRGERAIIF